MLQGCEGENKEDDVVLFLQTFKKGNSIDRIVEYEFPKGWVLVSFYEHKLHFLRVWVK